MHSLPLKNTTTHTPTPKQTPQDATHSRLRFPAPDPHALLRVTVGDWKIGKNLWIARLALPLASIEVATATATDPAQSAGVVKTYALRLRVSRFGKHIEREGESDARLVLRLTYEFPERAWTIQVGGWVGRGAACWHFSSFPFLSFPSFQCMPCD